MASSPLLDHILGRLHADLAFLNSQSVISTDDLHAIQARLPSPSGSTTHFSTPAPAPAQVIDSGLAGLSLGGGGAPSAAGEPRGAPTTARALWDYSQVQVSFHCAFWLCISEWEWWQGRGCLFDGVGRAAHATVAYPLSSASQTSLLQDWVTTCCSI